MRKRSPGEVKRLIREVREEVAGGVREFSGQPGPKSSSGHHVHQYLYLAASLGAEPAPIAPQLFVTPAELEEALARFSIRSDPAEPLFGLNPGAEYGPAKRWPADRFIVAAREIQNRTHCRWLVFGGKADTELANRIAAGIQAAPGERNAVTNLAGRTSLRDLCVLLRGCKLLLSNDSGPMHVAAAVGTPVVVPFGSTSPELTGPGLPGDRKHRLLRAAVPCAPCFLRECPIDFRCMRRIEPTDVISAVLEVINLNPAVGNR
jgi:heptosyltransferase-2